MEANSLKGKILLVDDTLSSIDLLKTVLEGEGYGVVVATSGEKALKRAELKVPDLILIDVLMPGLDGFETCRRLKAGEKTREIPVIFMTALGAPEMKVKGFEVGGVDYVTKPIDVEEVLARIRTHLALRTARQELEIQNQCLQQEVGERRRAEEEIRRLNQELEQRVEERTRELTASNRQLQEEIEERMRAVEELRNREEFLSLIVENIPNMIFIKEAGELRFVRFNKAGEELLGYAREELIGKNDYDFFPQNQADFFTGKDRAVLKKGTLEDVPEEPIQTRHLGERILHTKKIPIVDKSGKAQYLLGISEDITERKRMEEQLIESEKKFRSIVENSYAGIYTIDDTFHFIYVNDKACELTGYSRDELIGMDFRRLIAEESLPSVVERYLSRQKKDLEPAWHVIVVVRKDGAKRIMEYSASGFRNMAGRVITTGQFLDITDRKRAEEALKESEERYRVAIEGSNDGIAIVKNDRYLYVNQKFVEIFGYDRPEEIEGQPISIVLHPEDRDRVIELGHQRQGGEPVPSRYEFKGIQRDGGDVFIEVSATKTTYRGESVNLAFLRDITERKRLETLLHQAQKMEAIGTLAGGIAHDFNNILAVMLGGVELSLLEVPRENPAHGYMLEVLKATERATDLVRQILTFSRQKDLERKPLQLSILCKEALKMLRASIPATIEIQQYIDPHSGMALVDPTQVHQIIMNLCTNAAQAMGQGGGLLQCELKNRELRPEDLLSELNLSPGPYLELTVKDNGPGMEPSVLRRIFDPYFTTKGIGEGTGLGLAVVHGIITSYQGAIQVQSTPGQGTTFQVFIPRIEEMTGDPKRVKTPELPLGKEQILLVDDEEAIIHLSQKMLERLGYTVVASTSSQEALAIFIQQPDKFDLVITDHIMPKMTGMELAQEIIRIRPEMPMILMTGFGDIMRVEQAESSGIRKFIMKPLDIHTLAEKTRQVLDQKTED